MGARITSRLVISEGATVGSRYQGCGSSDRGSTPAEYALLLGMIALVIVGAVALLGHAVAGLYATALSGL
jgi:Flp pilus assembly pilin Flp